jgi:hypothetical protein
MEGKKIMETNLLNNIGVTRGTISHSDLINFVFFEKSVGIAVGVIESISLLLVGKSWDMIKTIKWRDVTIDIGFECASKKCYYTSLVNEKERDMLLYTTKMISRGIGVGRNIHYIQPRERLF